MLARWDDNQKKALIPSDRLRAVMALGVGQYRADIILTVDGVNQTVQKQFVVGEDADSLNWVAK